MSSIVDLGINAAPCGYCHSEAETSAAHEAFAHSITAGDYQLLMDRGWRRCGRLLYKPVRDQSCCKPFTIRTNAMLFRVSKRQRKCLRRFSRAVHDEIGVASSSAATPSGTDLDCLVSELEGAQNFQLRLEPARFDSEAFKLYQRYQMHVHGEPPEKLTRASYCSFLIDSAIQPQTSRAITYGTFHHKYYVCDKLIAVGVLDVLPESVSSVYFFYDPEWDKYSLGTVSALLEIALTRRLAQIDPKLCFYYMGTIFRQDACDYLLGLYIDDCDKLRYKARFGPPDVLDPSSLTWVNFEEASQRFGWEHAEKQKTALAAP